MEDLIELISSYSFSTILIILMLLISSFFGIYTIYNKIKSILEEYRKKKNAVENHDKDILDKIENLTTQLNDSKVKLSELESEVIKVKTNMKNIQDDLYKCNRVTSKAAVYKMANDIIAKGWKSQSDNTDFKQLVDIYIKTGDTDYVIPGLLQRAMDIQVLTDAEIEIKVKEQKE